MLNIYGPPSKHDHICHAFVYSQSQVRKNQLPAWFTPDLRKCRMLNIYGPPSKHDHICHAFYSQSQVREHQLPAWFTPDLRKCLRSLRFFKKRIRSNYFKWHQWKQLNIHICCLNLQPPSMLPQFATSLYLLPQFSASNCSLPLFAASNCSLPLFAASIFGLKFQLPSICCLNLQPPSICCLNCSLPLFAASCLPLFTATNNSIFKIRIFPKFFFFLNLKKW